MYLQWLVAIAHHLYIKRTDTVRLKFQGQTCFFCNWLLEELEEHLWTILFFSQRFFLGVFTFKLNQKAALFFWENSWHFLNHLPRWAPNRSSYRWSCNPPKKRPYIYVGFTRVISPRKSWSELGPGSLQLLLGPTFPWNTGCSIEILIMVYHDSPHIWVVKLVIYAKQPGALFSCFNSSQPFVLFRLSFQTSAPFSISTWFWGRMRRNKRCNMDLTFWDDGWTLEDGWGALP